MSHKYEPYKPPFKYNLDGQWIEDSAGNKLFDIRGWGFLTGNGGLRMNPKDAALVQDSIADHVVKLMNNDVLGNV
jgi:hypothetical protein